MTTRSLLNPDLTQVPALQLAAALFYEYILMLFRFLLIWHRHTLMAQVLSMDDLLTGGVLQIFLLSSSNLLLRQCTSLLTPMLHASADACLITIQLVLTPH